MEMEQYSLKKILTIWAIVALPMPILAFIVAPAIAPNFNLHPGIITWLLLVVGMIWQFIVSMGILYRELDEFTWKAIKGRIWLQKPSNPKSGKRSYKLFWWLVPAFIFYAIFELTPLSEILGQLMLVPFPFLSKLPVIDIQELMVPELIGTWWLLGVVVISNIFNYFLGEELLFRGILLPKMSGAFGKWDWAVNSLLFGLYHLHKPFVIIPTIFSAIAFSWPSRYFKSIWFGIILHGLEGIFVFVSVYMVVSGRAF